MLSASTLPHKRQSFIQVLGDSHHFPEITESNLLERVFGDQSGREYWRWWLEDDASELHLFVKMIASHNAKAASHEERRSFLQFMRKNDPDEFAFNVWFWPLAKEDPLFKRNYNIALTAFYQAAINKESWLWARHDRPDGFDDLLRGQFGLVQNSGLLVRRRSAAMWLANHSEFGGLLPASARAYLIKNFKQAAIVEAEALSPAPEPEPARVRKRRGRRKGSRPFLKRDRELLPVIDRMLSEGTATSADNAALQLAEAGRVAGPSTARSNATRLRILYQNERDPP